ncbi:MAG: recombination mediator RecR [Oscillospiraceae bacterium]|nr:recombination mediator RecR [Oscillospiraceae bacterium]
MEYLPPALETLVEQFAKLPGVGAKSAQRLAFYVLSMPEGGAEAVAQAEVGARGRSAGGPGCQNFAEGDGPCPVCADPRRDRSTICVVADPKDVTAMERGREYNGLYHVLHGVISPMNHVGPDDLRIQPLVSRVAAGDVSEVIMATNPDTEGEATAMYLARLLRPFGVRVTRLAYGVPVGSHLEFADQATLMRALEGRQEL